MKKIVLFVLGVLVGCFTTGIVLNINNSQNESTEYVCSHYSNEFDIISYIKPSTTIEFYQDNEMYFFNITLYLNDQIDFSEYSNNTSMFASISFDGMIPYSVFHANHKYIQIPLENGKMPETFNFTVSSEDNAFADEDLEILNKFLNHEEDSIVVSINLFDPEGIINQVTNVFVD